MSLSSFFINKKGFSLVEVLFAMAVFAIFAVGIYGGIQFVYKSVYQSRIKILQTSVLNEQIEIIRNMPFEDIGIVSGSPAGTLSRTTTTTRNGIDFLITRTIRNIDDPFDGTIGGTPNDTAPADYKLVHVDVICAACGQLNPVSLTTYIAPKYLEGDPTHGALFIEVFDANGVPVQDATVHVVATSTDPAIDLTETTDNNGMVRLVDLGEGVQAYHISVTKAGYTSAGTLVPTDTNSNPTKLPASVAEQNVTEISFSIDEVSSIELATIDALCAPVGNTSVSIAGTKLLGVEPDILTVNETIQTSAQGLYTWSTLGWDTYAFRAESRDIIGSIPVLPAVLAPGMTMPLQLLVGSNTAHSLLVQVTDSITAQPLSNATVRVVAAGVDSSKVTGLGSIRQTDWSGGSGQQAMGNATQYAEDNTHVEVAVSAGDIQLKQTGSTYFSDGWLESSVYDLGTEANFVQLNWEPFAQPTEIGDTAVRIQIATSNSSTPATWDYLGPDGTSATFYDAQSVAINDIHDGDQYFRYKIFLHTDDTAYSPTISDFSMTYTTSCTPPGQVYFGGLVNQSYTVEVTRPGYQSVSDTVVIDGDVLFSIDMVAE